MADPPGSPGPHTNYSAYPELLDDVKLEEDTEVNYDNPFQVADVLLGEPPLVVSPTDQTAPANANLPLNLLQANAPADNPTNGLLKDEWKLSRKNVSQSHPPHVTFFTIAVLKTLKMEGRRTSLSGSVEISIPEILSPTIGE